MRIAPMKWEFWKRYELTSRSSIRPGFNLRLIFRCRADGPKHGDHCGYSILYLQLVCRMSSMPNIFQANKSAQTVEAMTELGGVTVTHGGE